MKARERFKQSQNQKAIGSYLQGKYLSILTTKSKNLKEKNNEN